MGAPSLMKELQEFARLIAAGADAFEASQSVGVILKPCVRLDKYYVYVLVDSRNDKVFYVGKGANRRAFDHVSDWKNRRSSNAKKGTRIGQIFGSKGAVIPLCVADGMGEREAFDAERILIRGIGLKNLTNLAKGNSTKTEETLRLAEFAERMLFQITPFDEWSNYVMPRLKDDGYDSVSYYRWLTGLLWELIVEGRKARIEAT